MTTRTDISVDWDASPRIVTVAAPSTELTIQDLVDTLRVLESEVRGMSEPKLIDAAGKEPLGGGVLVGITCSLLNALVAFEARGGPSFVQCNISGGNLVAFDEFDVVLTSPIQTTAFTQVTLTSSSSATLQEQEDIQHAAFEGYVSIDPQNESGNAVSGTVFPAGTTRAPSDNLPDAILIAESRGFHTLFIHGDLTVQSGEDISGYTVIGEGATFNAQKTHITLASGAVTTGTKYQHCRIDGVQGGESVYQHCILGNITNHHCFVQHCGLEGPVQYPLSAGFETHVKIYDECYTSNSWFELDANATKINTTYTNFSGRLKITNSTDAGAEFYIHMNAGEIWVDASCTAGTFVFNGVGTYINDSAIVIDTDGLVAGHDNENLLTVTKFLALK